MSLARACSDWLQRQWYQSTQPHPLLLPWSGLFGGVVRLRKDAYAAGLRASRRMPVPVIVVGNLSVGGAGKTPLVIWLAQFLRQAGYYPGILSRGYGGRRSQQPLPVTEASDPVYCGDEPLLLARRAACPVYVHRDRGRAGLALLAEHPCDVLICDDGLQHYALQRDVEIAVVDGHRRYGNGALLPAGPLREPRQRMEEVDLVVCREGVPEAGEYPMQLHGDMAVNLRDPDRTRPLQEFMGGPLHAIAGIGRPEGFFQFLTDAGLKLTATPFPDHHVFVSGDLPENEAVPVIMTEKDAVKCRLLARDHHWYLPIAASLPDGFGERVLQLLTERTHGSKTA